MMGVLLQVLEPKSSFGPPLYLHSYAGTTRSALTHQGCNFGTSLSSSSLELAVLSCAEQIVASYCDLHGLIMNVT